MDSHNARRKKENEQLKLYNTVHSCSTLAVLCSTWEIRVTP